VPSAFPSAMAAGSLAGSAQPAISVGGLATLPGAALHGDGWHDMHVHARLSGDDGR
jgi:hypothetical protein